MVDLVKIRKKAGSKKRADEGRGKGAVAEERSSPSPPGTSRPDEGMRLEAPVPNEAEAERRAPRERKVIGPRADEEPEAKPSSPKPQAPPEPLPDRLQRFRDSAGRERADLRADQQAVVAEEAGSFVELLTFIVAGEQYAVDIAQIVEIITPRLATRVPNGGESIIGIISLRGMIVTILDIRRILGHPPKRLASVDSRIVVMEHAGETAGFIVDRVSRVIKIDPGQIESHPVVSVSEQSDFVKGVFRHQNSLYILLDLERLLA